MTFLNLLDNKMYNILQNNFFHHPTHYHVGLALLWLESGCKIFEEKVWNKKSRLNLIHKM